MVWSSPKRMLSLGFKSALRKWIYPKSMQILYLHVFRISQSWVFFVMKIKVDVNLNPDEMPTLPMDNEFGDGEQQASGDGHRRQATKDHSIQILMCCFHTAIDIMLRSSTASTPQLQRLNINLPARTKNPLKKFLRHSLKRIWIGSVWKKPLKLMLMGPS